MTFEKFRPYLAEFIENEFKIITDYALENQTCKRKAVGCSIIEANNKEETLERVIITHNGPSGLNNKCSNVVGNCGCSHAEPRAILKYLKLLGKKYKDNVWSIMICTYSPCTNCANIIVDSNIITAVVYKILTEHDIRGAEILKRSLRIFTVEEL